MASSGTKPRSCNTEPNGKAPVIDRNRCEGKSDCVTVCPYDVFDIGKLSNQTRKTLTLLARVKLTAHGGRQATVGRPEDCHACGLCVTACPEHAIRLA